MGYIKNLVSFCVTAINTDNATRITSTDVLKKIYKALE